MLVPHARLKMAALAAALIAVLAAPAFAEPGPHGGSSAVLRFLGVLRGQAKEIDAVAMEAYQTAPRPGSCAERRDRFRAMLPGALRFSRYARDIYLKDHEAKMTTGGLTLLDLGDGGSAYYEAAGRRYAEIRADLEFGQVIVIFRGTRLLVGTDISTNALSFIGLETSYYNWAATLVAKAVQDHPGMQVIATGQSLGGGLAIYAALRNPGVRSYAFNPAGLSLLTWKLAGSAERARTNAAVTVIAIRNSNHIDPVTALSLAGRSVLPGQIFVLETSVLGATALHGTKTIVEALERSVAADANGRPAKAISVCWRIEDRRRHLKRLL